MFETAYMAAFAAGLLGGVHCVGMCGGIVGALTFGLADNRRMKLTDSMPYQLAYNAGRIFSYVLAGGLMGGLGMLLAQLMPVYYAQRVLLAIAGVFMVLLGFYLADWWRGLSVIERLGSRIWQRIEPVARRMLPVRSVWQAASVGMLWGWLPCGLVYSMLVMAVSAGSALEGAGVMLAFGLGTLPNLLAIGALTGAMAHLSRSASMRRVAGVSVVLLGLYTLWQAW